MSAAVAIIRAVRFAMGPALLGWLLILAGGVIGFAPLAAFGWSAQSGSSRRRRIVAFLTAALGLALVMPTLA